MKALARSNSHLLRFGTGVSDTQPYSARRSEPFGCTLSTRRKWFDRGREHVSDVPAVSLVASVEFDSVRAGPRQSLALDGALTADHLAPPTLASTLLHENTGSNDQTTNFQESGFSNNL
jgi:hypothetical protein